MSKKYVLDANIFIEAKNRYYAFDIAPGFWNALIDQAKAGNLVSIDRVKLELDRGKDDLKKWADSQFKKWFVPTMKDTNLLQEYGTLMSWSQGTDHLDSAKAEFASATNADAWVAAYAKANNCTVVTHEEGSALMRRRILIPQVCRAHSIPYVTTFEMLRELKVKLS